MAIDYKAMADRLVEQKIFSRHNIDKYSFSPWSPDSKAEFFTAREACHDWRVVGACMEKAHMVFVERHERWQVRYDKAYGDRTREWHSAESLPLAIILAYLEATGEPQQG